MTIDNTSGMTTDAVDLLAQTGVELSFGHLKFLVLAEGVEEAVACMMSEPPERRAEIRQWIIKSLTRFQQRSDYQTAQPKKYDAAVSDMMLLHAIDKLTTQ